MALSPEERALVLDMADRLIDLYEQRDAALNAGDADRVHQLQTQIDATNAERQGILAGGTWRPCRVW